MNGLEEIQGYVKRCIHEKEEVKRTIIEIEEQRIQLAQQRNEKKATNSNETEINELGMQITKLGNQSQELQNKLDSSWYAIKSQMNLMIDNFVVEGIRKVRIINQEIEELQAKNENQKDRSERYELQRREFNLRFGRMPELSERAQKENDLQEKEATKNAIEIHQKKQQIIEIEEEITQLAKIKRDVKNGNWNKIVEADNIDEDIRIEEIKIEEMESIEEIYVEHFQEIEELYIEEFAPIEEITIEAFSPIEEITVEEFKPLEENYIGNVENIVEIDEIEELARAIVEEIAIEQTKNYNKIEEKEDKEEAEIIFEKEENAPKSKVIIPLFGQKATISTIVVKFEEGELVYKAQMSDDEIIKVYPSNIGQKSVVLRDKQNREECRDILTNYAVNEYKVFDKKVVNKIDPLVCELLIECAAKYNFNAQELMYNYAMSFVQGESVLVPDIIYNISYIEESNLSKKEKSIMKRICRNARKNHNIEIIESFTAFKKFKYILRRIFAVNNVNLLTDGNVDKN